MTFSLPLEAEHIRQRAIRKARRESILITNGKPVAQDNILDDD